MGQAGATLPKERSIGDVSTLIKRREVGAILAVFVLVLVGSLIRADVFLSGQNAVGVLRNTATVAIIGYGMTLLMVSGEFDLSVGSWMAVAAALTATLFLDGWPILLVIALVLLLSVIYGLFQGLLVTKLGLPSLIVTIGTLTLLRGILLVIVGGVTITVSDPGALFYLGGSLDLSQLPVVGQGRMPVQIVWMLLLLAAGYYILNWTAFGYRSQFTGGDQDSARRTGVKTDQVKIINFMVVAVLAAFAGIAQLGFTQAVGPLTGEGTELIVIAAVVIGGTNLFGGEGSMVGTFLGALVFALTQNVLVLAGLGTQLFEIFTGIFIIAAVLVEVLSRDVRPRIVLTGYLDPLKQLSTSPKDFFQYVKTDVQGIDKPITFLSISTLVLSALTLGLLYLGDLLVPWEFDFLVISAGASAFGTVPVVAFGLVTALALLSAVFVHGTVKAFGSSRDFDTTLQAVIFSMAPSVLLFVPILLSGWGFLQPLVGAVVGIIALPTLYLLYQGVRILHDLDTTRAVVSVAATAVLWILILVYVSLRAPPV
jgi:simple sugar transport system permease protein